MRLRSELSAYLAVTSWLPKRSDVGDPGQSRCACLVSLRSQMDNILVVEMTAGAPR
jgi:hypothetical protein